LIQFTAEGVPWLLPHHSAQKKLSFLNAPEIVAQGGHSIPPEVIRRRLLSALRHFATLYQPSVDAWQLLDNGGDEPLLLAEKRNR
jgi:predicted ABC-type ATPase